MIRIRNLQNAIPAPEPARSRSARHSRSGCPVLRWNEAPLPPSFRDGASTQAGTIAPWALDGSSFPSSAPAVVSAALSSRWRPARSVVLAAAAMSSIAFFAASARPLLAQDVRERARAAAESSRAKSSDNDALLKNYVTPGLAGGAVTTVDGKSSFTPTISCQKTAVFLEIVAQPAASGDIGLLRIARDANLDGAIEQSLDVTMPLSGICANGVISCRPGTWSGCDAFKWSVAGGEPSLTAVAFDELAGCYCINNSCGSNLAWANMGSVLKDLGGGVVGALTTADPRIGVAEARIEGPVIRYTGAQTTSCASNPVQTASAYRANPAAIQSDAFAASRMNPVFQALAASSVGNGSAQQRRACTVSREIAVKEVAIADVIARTSGGYATRADASGKVDFFLGSPATHSLRSRDCRLFDFSMTLTVGDPARIRSARLSFLAADDWAQVRVDGMLVASGPTDWTGTGLPPRRCERDGTSTYAPGVDLKPYLTKGSHEVWLRLAVADRGNGYAQIQAEVDTSCQMTERVVDLCAGYAGDTNCRLADETVDGVETVRASVRTGLKPFPQTRLVGSASCTRQITRDFFTRERSYLCAIDVAGISKPDLSRGAYIIDHSTETLLADRIVTRSGAAINSTRRFALPEHASMPACESICKTRAPTVNAGVAPAGVVGAQQNDPASHDTFYHVCDAGSACPLGPGEELVSPCGCLDDFPEAAVMMQTLRLGGVDLACTARAR